MNNTNTISFINKEELNPISFTVMGASVKKDASAIGWFGSGMKYSIAVMLRNNIKFSIETHGKTFSFDTVKKDFRGEEMDIVTCNFDELGYTTEFGKQWSLEAVFRELYCNTLDEGGSVELGGAVDASQQTVISIDDHRMVDEYHQRDANFLFNSIPIHTAGDAQIHRLKSGSIKRCYYKGVKTQEGSYDMQYAYNVTAGLELTEDRTLKYMYQWNEAVTKVIVSLTDKKMIQDILTAEKFTFEQNVSFESYIISDSMSDEFKEIAQEYERKGKITNDSLRRYIQGLNPKTIEDWVKPITANEDKQLQEAYKLLESNDHYVQGWDLKKFEAESVGHLGQAKDGIIYIAQKVFLMGPRELAITILEEHLHLKTGFGDETRQFQNALFEEIGVLMEKVKSLKEANEYALS